MTSRLAWVLWVAFAMVVVATMTVLLRACGLVLPGYGLWHHIGLTYCGGPAMPAESVDSRYGDLKEMARQLELRIARQQIDCLSRLPPSVPTPERASRPPSSSMPQRQAVLPPNGAPQSSLSPSPGLAPQKQATVPQAPPISPPKAETAKPPVSAPGTPQPSRPPEASLTPQQTPPQKQAAVPQTPPGLPPNAAPPRPAEPSTPSQPAPGKQAAVPQSPSQVPPSQLPRDDSAPPPTAPPPASAPPASPAVDMSFLKGCWRSDPFKRTPDEAAGVSTYCFDADGRGQLQFTRPSQPDYFCRTPAQAALEDNTLHLRDSDSRCSDGSAWYADNLQCRPPVGDVAECSGQTSTPSGAETWTVRLHRQS
ncbi:MAG: hypothetical protein ACHQK9_06260 [Reyranellales bacterium]